MLDEEYLKYVINEVWLHEKLHFQPAVITLIQSYLLCLNYLSKQLSTHLIGSVGYYDQSSVSGNQIQLNIKTI